jgi:hypothetical protein
MMKNKLLAIEEKAENALRRCLERVPFLKIGSLLRQAGAGNFQVDILVTIVLPDCTQELVVEIKNNGQPRIAHEAVNQLLRLREVYPDGYGVFIAPYISTQAAEICIKDGIGYVDLAGNCRLSFGRVYIEQVGNPNPYSVKRDLQSLYSPKASRILRVLLNDPKRFWKTQNLAKEAMVSLGQTANIKKLLGDREWIESTSSGFSLTEPEKLLKEWSENYTYQKNTIKEYYTLKSLADIEADLSQAYREKGIRYALTGFSGAARIAPNVRYQKAMAYVSEQSEEVVSQLTLKEVPSGANMLLFTPYDEGVFYGVREIDGISIVSSVQLYLDLKNIPGRGEEAAMAVFEEAIRPTW